MIVTAQDYGQFLINTHTNVTGTFFADTVDELSHDSVYRFLRDQKITPAVLREKAMPVLVPSSQGFVIFDDTVIDKNHSRSIQLVRKQYSGNAHRVIRGIGVVTCIYYNPDMKQFFVLDYRIFDKDTDGKTKIDHVKDMFDGLISRQVPFRTVLMDTWYATTGLMMHIDTAKKIYACPVKANRLVDDTGGTAPYRQVSQLEWTKQEREEGKTVKVRGFPADVKHKLFRVTVSTDRTDMVITNDLTQSSTDDVQKAHAIRWTIEEFHRELKQLTGIEHCQSRQARAQRNHIGMAIQAWLYLKQAARTAGVTIYEQKTAPLRHFIAQQWRNPTTTFG